MDFTDPIRLRCIGPLRTPKRRLQRESIPSAEEITGLSRDTLKRRYPHFIRELSERREGMQLGDALTIASGKQRTSTSFSAA
jgi:hypothetical protein